MKNVKKLLLLCIGIGILGIFAGMYGVSKIWKRELAAIRQVSYKHLRMFKVLNIWMDLKQKGSSVGNYLYGHGYKRIAIYGMHYLGERLFLELRDTPVEIAYGIDKNTIMIDGLTVLNSNDQLETVDMIIVTAITYFDGIKQALEEKIKCPIVSLEDILYDMNNMQIEKKIVN